jgi:hypothetical protein
LITGNKIDKSELDFLLRYPIVLNVVSPVDFLSNVSWGGIKALANMDQFRNLDKDIEVNPKLMGLCVVEYLNFCMHRDPQSAGRSLQTVNVRRRRSFLVNGRTRTPFRNCA